VFAEVTQPDVLAGPVGQQLGVPAHSARHLAEHGQPTLSPPGERRRQVGEQPRAAEAPPADHHAGAAGFTHHAQCVFSLPDVAIAEHRNVEQLGELCDRRPGRISGVEVGRGAAVQRDIGGAGVLRAQAGLAVGEVLSVDAEPHLHRDRDCAGRGAHRGRHDLGEQPHAPGQRGPTALAGHLRHRAAEVEVDVIGQIVLHDQAHRGTDHPRVDAVELNAARTLVGREPDQPHRLRIAFDQRPRGDHLADVQARTMLATQSSERDVGDACHRRQHDRRFDDQLVQQPYLALVYDDVGARHDIRIGSGLYQLSAQILGPLSSVIVNCTLDSLRCPWSSTCRT
jgi:hypothetical protein